MAEIVNFGLQQHKIKMDSRYFENVLSVVAGDTGRRLEVQLLDTNGMVQNTTGLNLRLNAEIAGKATYTDATLVDAVTGKYQLDLSNGMFLAPGNWQFQWQITDSAGKKLHSFAFTGNIGKNISEGGSQATNFYLNLEDLKAMQDDLVNGTIDSSILETNITEKLNNLEEQYAPKLTEVTEQLAKTETEIASDLNKKRDKTIAITLSDLDTTVKSAMTGGSVAVVDANSTGTENIKLGAVTPEVTTFISTGKNLINIKTLIQGFFVNPSNGNLTANASYLSSDYIPVKPQTLYSKVAIHVNYYAFYDKNKVFITGIGVLSDTFTTPLNAYYMRVCGSAVNFTTSQLQEGGTLELGEKYELLLAKDVNILKSIPSKSISTEYVSDLVARYKIGKNLFNKNTKKVGQLALYTTGIISSNPNYNMADYFPIKPNTNYAVNLSGQIAIFGEQKGFLRGFTDSVLTFNSGDNARYMIISIPIVKNIDNLQVEEGIVSTAFTPHRLEPVSELNGVPISGASKLSYDGQIVSTIGDSITAQEKWQKHIIAELGFLTHHNYGIGGSTVSSAGTQPMCTDERIDVIDINSDVILFMGGTNDWAQDVILGSINDTGSSTFYGACKMVAEKLTIRFPEKRIVFLGTPYGKYPDRVSWTDKYGLKNKVGLTSGDYARVVLEVARLYGFPAVDIYGKAGWNDLNIDKFVTFDGAFLHPNDKGGKRIGEVVVGEMKKIAPIN